MHHRTTSSATDTASTAGELYLVDAMNLLYRAHFALAKQGLTNGAGLDTGAIFGFTNSMLRLLEAQGPSHLVVVFDGEHGEGGPGDFRKAAFAEYKANRDAMPEGVRVAIPLVKQILEALGVRTVEYASYEADDVIGTLAVRALKADKRVTIVTGDKDFQQLLAEGRLRILRPGKAARADWEMLTEARFREAVGVGVSPAQYRDVLALMGDASDNVPGVPGIGPKTAAQLVARYGSVEQLLQSVEQLEAHRVRTALQQSRGGALLSKQLVTIKTDVELARAQGARGERAGGRQHEYVAEATGERWWQQWRRTPVDVARALQLFADLGFRRLGRRVRLLGAATLSTRPTMSVHGVGAKASETDEAAQVTQSPTGHRLPHVESGGDGSADAGSNGSSATTLFQDERLEYLTSRPSDVVLAALLSQCTAVGLYVECVPTDAAVSDTRVPSKSRQRRRRHPRSATGTESSAPTVATVATTTDAPPASLRLRIGIAVAPGRAVDLCVDAAQVPEPVLQLLRSPQVRKVGFRLKEAYQICQRQLQLCLQGELFDVMIAHHLLDPEESLPETWFPRRYLGDLGREILQRYHMGEEDAADDALRASAMPGAAAACADVARRAMNTLEARLRSGGVDRLARQVELPLVPVLAEMELRGVYLDRSCVQRMQGEVAGEIARVEEQVFALAGQRFNLASPAQLAQVLFGQLGVSPLRTTRSGQPSTSEKVLEALARGASTLSIRSDSSDTRRPASGAVERLAVLVLKHRELFKLHNTYLQGLEACIHPFTGRIHTTFHQDNTSTGRLSTSHPNLQAIPIRSPLGRLLRGAFRAAPVSMTAAAAADASPKVGATRPLLLSADYAQIEMRIMAALSGDRALREAFAQRQDVHALTAMRLYGLSSLSQVTAEQRAHAKEVNYGIPYGLSAYGLSQRLRVPLADARRLLAEYHAAFPAVAALTERLIREARDTGYASTLMGRRRYLPRLHAANGGDRREAERAAVNMPIQGTQADMIKVAMVRIAHRLGEAGSRARLILQIHDELLFEVPATELSTLTAVVREEMERALPLPNQIPVAVRIGHGDTWLAAHG
ncbi:hypothetical protein CDCA_CDCA02G0682 [Cyanidium caldarium]|uniref:DNA-directed DNA polymerase n=1 Tax=Cyanidium caldarium TaxID=2771 RepID=A0AAV9IQL2_CYACA|nr:hypothetical protein CDCA_CDCA02G0682 [Cyanidium caldarium]